MLILKKSLKEEVKIKASSNLIDLIVLDNEIQLVYKGQKKQTNGYKKYVRKKQIALFRIVLIKNKEYRNYQMKIIKSMNSFIQLKKKNTFSSIRSTNKICN